MMGKSSSTESSAFSRLKSFIEKRMRMSHIYQPVMLGELLRKGGAASVDEIAKAILAHDPSQAEYYSEITKSMVGRVLAAHGIVARQKQGRRVTGFALEGVDDLSHAEIEELIALCEVKVDDYLAARGQRIWDHRRKSSGVLSGTLKYEVLKRAKFRCELCGVSAEERALEVDHIIPRQHGGTDDISNLQALCYSCNAMKRDRDDTDFRDVAESYAHREAGCVFCDADERVLTIGKRAFANELAIVIEDRFPVTERHVLILPRRHVVNYFDLYQPELNAIHALAHEARSLIEASDRLVTGFNLGINTGVSAGQTVMHCHLHLIPRRDGDIDNPRGGVRGVIPSRRGY